MTLAAVCLGVWRHYSLDRMPFSSDDVSRIVVEIYINEHSVGLIEDLQLSTDSQKQLTAQLMASQPGWSEPLGDRVGNFSVHAKDGVVYDMVVFEGPTIDQPVIFIFGGDLRTCQAHTGIDTAAIRTLIENTYATENSVK